MKHWALLLFASLGAAFGQKLAINAIPNPSAIGSLQPNWSAAPDGAAVLSWIEPVKGSKTDAYALRYAVRRGETWSEARTIASDRHFFRHPAEAPGVQQLGDKLWMAHWIEMPDEESEAEFVYVSSSVDGVKWTLPSIAHRDRTKVEHGLASMVASGPAEASILWLETPQGEDGPAYLMRTVVNAAGKEVKEERIDADVCTCCPTAVAKTTKGLVVAFRDHTPADIRDIAVTRFEAGKWTTPKIVHADNWKINACPINAATVAAKGDHVVVAWYTGAGNAPKVQALFSDDGGATFGKPAVVSTGHAYGFTSATLTDDKTAMVSWLEQGTGKTRVLVRQINSTGAASPAVQAAEGDKMDLGYPRLIQSQAGTLLAWSAADGKLQTARVTQ